jgi:hypothetical protein
VNATLLTRPFAAYRPAIKAPCTLNSPASIAVRLVDLLPLALPLLPELQQRTDKRGGKKSSGAEAWLGSVVGAIEEAVVQETSGGKHGGKPKGSNRTILDVSEAVVLLRSCSLADYK